MLRHLSTALVSLPLALALACDRPAARTEPVPAEVAPAATNSPPPIKSCMVQAEHVCHEFAERPELAASECGAGGQVREGPCPAEGRVGTCTMLVATGGAHTVQHVHYTGGRSDAEAKCKASSGTWKR